MKIKFLALWNFLFFILTPVVIKIGCHENKLTPLETAKPHTDATTKRPTARAKICTTMISNELFYVSLAAVITPTNVQVM